MSKKQKPALTKEQLESVSHLSSAQAAIKLGYSKTAVTESRNRLGMKREVGRDGKVTGAKGGKIEQKSDGSIIVESTDSVPQTRDHIESRMRDRGFDPAQYSFTYGFSEWQAQSPEGVITMYSARASATERKKTMREALPVEDILSLIDAYEPIRGEGSDAVPSGTFVFCFADPQVGKTDINGGTDETIARFMASLDHACAILDENPPEEIIFADLGDGIENFCNTSSQRQTNDLNLVEQVRILRRMQMTAILRLAEYAPIKHISVPSNHSQNRVGFQQPASTSHDDWGIEVQTQLKEILYAMGADAPNVEFIAPAEHLESVSATTADGTILGFVHGHRSNSQNGLEAWWAGQALGNQPTALAQILFVGHFHNLSLRSVGDNRYIITTPSLDNGSSWFTVSRGNMATAGVLTLRVRNGVPTDMLIV